MTDENAIKHLKQLYPNGGHCWLDEQRIDAISIAINAIESKENVRAEIERLRKSFKVISVASPSKDTTLENIAKAALCRQILSFIDSMQEESAPKIFEDMLNAKTPAESLGISQEEHDRIVDELIYGKEPELVDVDDLPNKEEEPVSEELEEAAIEICSKVLKGETITIDGYEYFVLSDAEECFKAGAKWQKEYMMKEIKIRLVDAATNQDKSTDVVEQTYYNGMVDALGRLRDKFMED